MDSGTAQQQASKASPDRRAPAPSGLRDLKTRLAAEARALGFDSLGIAAAEADPKDRQALAAFLKNGWQGDMAWLDDADGRRGDPQALMADARAVIVLGVNYGPSSDPRAALRRTGRGTISVYAQGRDYHDLIKKRLKRLARWLIAEAKACGDGQPSEDTGQEPNVKVFVDTAPVMEKPLAARAGLGWQGKHTNLVSRDYGSWLFLGEIVTNIALPPDLPEADHCGSCDACLQACPTDAFPAPYQLDATKCISYLTIEHKGPIDAALMARMGNHVYGCDDCLAACPWNKFAEPTTEHAFYPRMELAAPRLADLAALDDAAFRQVFSGSPIKRTGRDRFVRNVLIAIGNGGDPSHVPLVRDLMDDPSPLVAGAAAWAHAQLTTTETGEKPAA